MGKSDFLFATPSFLTGAGRSIDLGAYLEGCSYNISATAKDADLWAIAQDWAAVGNDLRKATETAEVPEVAPSAR